MGRMNAENQARLVNAIRESLMPSTGCTEPVALALSVATARKHAAGEIRSLTLTLDPYLYKNAMGVGIPGSDERGVALCAALGYTAGDADKCLLVLSDVTQEKLAQAKALEHLVVVNTLPDAAGLYIETVLETDTDQVRVLTLNQHTNIVSVEHAPFSPCIRPDAGHREPCALDGLNLCELIAFADEVPTSDLVFLQDAVDMNVAVAEEGYQMGLGRALTALIEQGVIGKSPVAEAQRMCASASYARMAGVPLPIMTATGSGNQGITLFLTVEAVAREMKIDQEKKLRGMALAALINVYVKSFTGALSAVCACGVASGLSASVGVVHMLGGGEREMLGAMKNVLGSISGMICDGAKEGCANKVELSSGLAVQAAFLAVNGMSIVESDGILGGDLGQLFENLGELVQKGMCETNRVIVDIMQGKAGR